MRMRRSQQQGCWLPVPAVFRQLNRRCSHNICVCMLSSKSCRGEAETEASPPAFIGGEEQEPPSVIRGLLEF